MVPVFVVICIFHLDVLPVGGEDGVEIKEILKVLIIHALKVMVCIKIHQKIVQETVVVVVLVRWHQCCSLAPLQSMITKIPPVWFVITVPKHVPPQNKENQNVEGAQK